MLGGRWMGLVEDRVINGPLVGSRLLCKGIYISIFILFK